MLEIVIPETEQWDEVNQEFITSNRQILRLEHSLVSLSKWKKPFLSNKEKTYEETIDYIKCMTLTQNVNDTVYNLLDKDNIEKINKYIGDPMTATTFKEDPNKKGGREIITSELIY